MSQSPETAPAALPYIYKNPFSGPGLAEGDTFGHGEDLAPRPGLVVEGRSDDIDITDNRTPEMGVEDGLFSAEAHEVSDADQAGRLARMGSFVTSKFVELKTSAQESISNGVKKHPKLVAGMAAFAIIGGAAEQATGETNPVNQKASASALTGNALKQLCVKEALEMPKVTRAMMYNPGRDRNPRIQGSVIDMSYDAMPKECNGIYRRFGQATAKLQSPKNPRRWYNLAGSPKWHQTLTDDHDPNIVGKNQADDTSASFSSNGHEGSKVFYKCTSGKRKTHARYFIRNQVKDMRSRKIIGQKITKGPIKIEGGGC